MFSDPQSIIAQLDLQSGYRVADFGAGSGFYTIASAKAVGDKGRVYAIDVQKDLVEKVKNSARGAHLLNVEAIWGDVENLHGTKLADGTIDAVIVANILFQLTDKDGFLAEAKRILKSKGKLLVVDWKDSYGGMGPSRLAVVSKEQAKAMFEKSGFKYEREVEAGEHHYGLIFKKI